MIILLNSKKKSKGNNRYGGNFYLKIDIRYSYLKESTGSAAAALKA